LEYAEATERGAAVRQLSIPCGHQGSLRCEGHLFIPRGGAEDDRPPLVILVQGLGAQQEFSLGKPLANALDVGAAVITFDFRHFGGSDGEPRHHIDRLEQIEDVKSVIAHARSELAEGVDSSRIALHGFSFGGGHALEAAAEDGGISAVLATVPRVEGSQGSILHMMRHQPKVAFGVARILATLAKEACAQAVTGRQSFYIPLRGQPGSPAILQSSGSSRKTIVPEALRGGWENKITAASMFSILRGSPMTRAATVRSPVFLTAATDDGVCPPSSIKKLASMLPNATYVEIPGEHYEAFSNFPAAEHQAFLKQHLGLGPAD